MTVFPKITAPSPRRPATTLASDVAILCRPSLAPAGSWQSLDVNDVFNADRDAMEGTAIIAGVQLVIASTCPLERALAVEHDPSVYLGSHSSTRARQSFRI